MILLLLLCSNACADQPTILALAQSGVKSFRLADPIHNHDLFILAEKEIKRIENEKENIQKYKPLIKLYDRADIINDIA